MISPSAATLADAPAAPHATLVIPELEQLRWSVQRELWEHRYLYGAPLLTAALLLFAFIVSPFGLRHSTGIEVFDPSQARASILSVYSIAAGLLMLSTVLVGLYYCLDALYSERRDRSILFWKSLPVSDRTTVLSKALIPLVVLPLVTFAFTVATQLVMLLLSTLVLLGHGTSPAGLWSALAPDRMWGMLLYHLVAVHSLWYAPVFAWLLLISAWARRTPLLWAVLPPLGLVIFERLVFHTSYLAGILSRRLTGSAETVASGGPGMLPIDPGMHMTLGHYLASPGLWLGLAVAAVLLALTVRVRRYREPI